MGGVMRRLFILCVLLLFGRQGVLGQSSVECGFIVKQPLTSGQEAAYYDRFGNDYTKEEVSLSFYPNAQRLLCNSGYFDLSFVGDWTANEEATACQVFSDLSTLLIAANPDDMPPINILLKKEALGSTYAGVGTPFFEADCGMVDSKILYHLNNAFEQDYPLQFLGTVQINSDLNWHTVANDTGTFETPNVPANKLDLYTTMLHEAIHVLGFLSRITTNGSALDGFYSRWDKYLYSVPQSASLLIAQDNEDCCNYYGFNSAVFDNMPNDFANGCDLRLAFRNNAGANVAAVNISDYTSFGGSGGTGLFLNKLSHLDYSCQDELGFTSPKAVMHPGVEYGEARRIVTEPEKNILCTLGYHVNGLTACEQNCEVFTNPDQYLIFLVDGNTINISVNGANGLLSNDVHPEGVTVTFDTECSYFGNLTAVVTGGESISITAITEGIYHFCYTVESCNNICRTEEVTIIVKQEPLSTQCNDPYCNIVCFGDFEEFTPGEIGADNYFYQLDIPPFRFTEAGNSPDVIEFDDNNLLHIFRCANCDIESIAIPLSTPIPPDCEVVITYNATALHSMYLGNNPNIVPTLQFTALNNYPCDNFPYFNCTEGTFNICGGTAATSITPDACGQAIDYQVIANGQFSSATDAIDFNNLPTQTFSWVNNTGQDVTTLLINGSNSINDYSEVGFMNYFIDNIKATLQCEEHIEISATDQDEVCTNSSISIPYQVCLENPESTTGGPVTVTIDANIEDIAGVSVNAGGAFNGAGQATVSFDPATTLCATVNLNLYIGNNFETGDQINISIEAFSGGGYCTDGNASGMNTLLNIVDCGFTPPVFDCLDLINYYTVTPASAGVSALNEFGVSRPSYTPTVTGVWSALSHPFLALTGANPIYFNTDLVIPAGVTLTINNLQLRFAPDRRILVQPGGWLKINNCTIDGVCETMWQGIQVQGPGNAPQTSTNVGKLDLLSGNINNAIIGATGMNLAQLNTFAIGAFDWPADNDYTNTSSLTLPILWTLPARNTAGGVINTNGTHFNDCFQGLNFSWKGGYGVDNAQFLKIAADLQYPFDALTTRPEAGVSALSVGKLFVTNCTFRNLKYGVRSNDANYLAAKNNLFMNEIIGISARQILGIVAQSTAINANQFEDCQLAVQADGVDYNKMADNTVNNLGNSQVAYSGENLSLGFYLRGTNSIIKNNFIHRTDFGMVINQSDTEGSLVAGNLVNNTQEALLVEGNNPSTRFKCNHLLDYTLSGLDLRKFNTTNGHLPQQGECDPSAPFPEPAANTFIANVGSGAIDIRLGTDVETLEYHDVGATTLTVDDNSAIGNFEPENCPSTINLNDYCSTFGYTSFDDVDNYVGIGAMQDRLLAQKVLNLVADSNYNAAIALLHQYNTTLLAKRRLVPHKIGMDSTATARNLLDQISADTEENLRYKQLYTLLIDLKESNRSLFDISPAQQALLLDIANSRTKTSYKAQAILYLARGIDFSVALPTLSSGIGNWHTVFKTDTNGKVGTLYPNPTQKTISFEHRLAVGQTGKLTIYDLTGKQLSQYPFVGIGQQQLSLAHLQAGMYLYTMQIDGLVVQKDKLVLIP